MVGALIIGYQLATANRCRPRKFSQCQKQYTSDTHRNRSMSARPERGNRASEPERSFLN